MSSIKQLFTISTTALKQINYLLKSNDKQFLKLSLKSGGCSGLSYNLEFSEINKKTKLDEIVANKIIVDYKSIIHLVGMHMDYQDDVLNSKFIFINPNSKGECGCGKSFTV